MEDSEQGSRTNSCAGEDEALTHLHSDGMAETELESDFVSERNFEDILREIYWYCIRDNGDCGSSEDLSVRHVVSSLKDEGILFWRDQRFRESQDVALKVAGCERAPFTGKISTEAREAASADALDYGGFVQLVSPCSRHFLRAFTEELVIPDFSTFVADMTYHYYQVKDLTHGQTAQYIPILRDAEPEYWGLSMCSIDGQRFSIGDALVKHSLQSISKPVTYVSYRRDDSRASFRREANVPRIDHGHDN